MSHSLPRLVKWYELKIRHTSTLLDLTRRVGVGFSLKKVIPRCYIIPYQLPARFCYSSETPPPPPPSLSPLTDACRGIGAGGTFEIPLIRADTNKEVNSRVALMKCVKDAARSAPRRRGNRGARGRAAAVGLIVSFRIPHLPFFLRRKVGRLD